MLIDNEKHSLATLNWITVVSTFDKNEFNYYTEDYAEFYFLHLNIFVVFIAVTPMVPDQLNLLNLYLFFCFYLSFVS